MNEKIFPIKIKKIKDGFEASLVDIPNCKAIGRTAAEAYSNVKYSMNEHVLDSILNDKDMPTPSNIDDDELTSFVVVDIGDSVKARERLKELTNPKLRIKNKIGSIIGSFLIFVISTNVVEFVWNNILTEMISVSKIDSIGSLIVTAIFNLILFPFFILIARKE